MPTDHPVHLVAQPIAAASGGTNWGVVLGTLFAGISAFAVVVGLVYWFATRRSRSERGDREKQVSTDVAEMGDRLEHLQRIVDGLADEQRARRPQPRVAFATADGPASAVVVRRPAVPAVDVEAIVESERGAALATLLPVGDAEAKPRAGALGAFAALGAYSRSRYLPVTEADHDEFKVRVDAYEKKLRSFIPRWLAFLETRRRIVYVRAHVENDGGAPADEARLHLNFPDLCRREDVPETPGRPGRPEFKQRENPLVAGVRVPRLDYFPTMPTIKQPNISGPFYDDGSLKVSFIYRSIPHHDPFQTEPFVVGIPEAGTFAIEWTIGAKNLSLPEKGTLTLEVRDDDTVAEPITTLAALLTPLGSRSSDGDGQPKD